MDFIDNNICVKKNKMEINKNGFTFITSTRIGECGFKSKKIYFPFFLMGACGIDEAVISYNGEREYLKVPKKMNLLWFKTIADKLKANRFYDWDWQSFSNNILRPNREQLKNDLSIDDKKVDVLLEDGYIFIEDFDKNYDEDEDEINEAIKSGEIGYYPSFINFLKYDPSQLEY